jgi:hypothetical protein
MEAKVSEFIAPNSQRAIEQAKAEKLDVVFPEKNQLQLDIDNDTAYAVYKAHYDIVDGYWGIEYANEQPSRSGTPGKKHITVTLTVEVSNKDRIALQAFLGSDLKREVLSFIQEEDGDPHPTLFLEKPATPLLKAPVQDEEIGELVTDDPEHANHIATFQV